MPDIPLSVGSKLELLRGSFAKFPYTSPYTRPRMHIAAIIILYISLYNVYTVSVKKNLKYRTAY